MTNDQTLVTLNHLLDYDARKFTNAEVQLKKSLTGWINDAGSLKLKTVLQRYLELVQDHIKKLELFIEAEKIDSISMTNRVMYALIEETNEKLSYCADTETRDACLLASVQAMSHFKICTYGTAAAFANTLGMEKHAALFHEVELNEKEIDNRLSHLAEEDINTSARTPIELPN
jgi:ferritin-like metal-binding protein YciE